MHYRTVDDVMDYLAIQRRTVYKLCAKGMPHKRLGLHKQALYRFDMKDIEAWVDRNAEHAIMGIKVSPRNFQEGA